MNSKNLSKDITYCVGCKRNTKTLNASIYKTKNNRTMIKGTCAICGRKKSTFIKVGGFINTLLNHGKYIPEMHLPGYNYAGPFTKLETRLKRGDKPINKLDEAAMHHDVAYHNYKDKPTRWKHDKVLQDKAYNIMLDPNTNVKNKIEAGLVAGTMYGKRKLGLGQK